MKTETVNQDGFARRHAHTFVAIYLVVLLLLMACMYFAYEFALVITSDPAHHRYGQLVMDICGIVKNIPVYLLAGMASGMLGAIVKELKANNGYSSETYAHFAKFRLWYLTAPSIGAVLGLFTYALLSFASGSGEPNLVAVSIAAFLFGLNNNAFIEQLDRLFAKKADRPDDSKT